MEGRRNRKKRKQKKDWEGKLKDGWKKWKRKKAKRKWKNGETEKRETGKVIPPPDQRIWHRFFALKNAGTTPAPYLLAFFLLWKIITARPAAFLRFRTAPAVEPRPSKAQNALHFPPSAPHPLYRLKIITARPAAFLRSRPAPAVKPQPQKHKTRFSFRPLPRIIG